MITFLFVASSPTSVRTALAGALAEKVENEAAEEQAETERDER